MAIKRHDMERWLKTKVVPRMGSGWFVYQGDSILRVFGIVLQGIHMDCSRYNDAFCPTPFVQVSARLSEDLALTVGKRLQNTQGGPLWMDWGTDNEALADLLFAEIRQQVRLPIDTPLTLAMVADYIERHHLTEGHFAPYWEFGCLRGMMGDLSGAQAAFDSAEQNLQSRAEGWLSKGEAAPEWIAQSLALLREYRSQLKDQRTFRAFCEQQAARTKAALRLP